jgi:peptidoglycan hydrolase-like protein with peptidoglycan-binding domain
LSPGVEGSDVKQFEKNLWALGYRGFTVDDEYTSATADAVEDWQDDLGLTETGTVETSQIEYASTSIRIDTQSAEKGTVVQPGTELAKYTATALVATVELDMDSQRLAKKGATVQVTLPDGKTVKGKISDVGTTVQEGQGEQEDTTLIKVTVSFTGAPKGMDDASVTVGFTASQRADVLTVPVAALLALAEGGYGVQVVDGATSKFVAVETGLFADGKVEIKGDGLQPGMKVGMPV